MQGFLRYCSKGVVFELRWPKSDTIQSAPFVILKWWKEGYLSGDTIFFYFLKATAFMALKVPGECACVSASECVS